MSFFQDYFGESDIYPLYHSPVDPHHLPTIHLLGEVGTDEGVGTGDDVSGNSGSQLANELRALLLGMEEIAVGTVTYKVEYISISYHLTAVGQGASLEVGEPECFDSSAPPATPQSMFKVASMIVIRDADRYDINVS